MKKYIGIAVVTILLVTGGCVSSKVISIPYDSVRVHVESEFNNPDHLTVWVGGIETNMPTRQALTLLSNFYSSHKGSPPPMILHLETKLALLDKAPDGSFLDTVMALQSRYNFPLYIQPLPYSQCPNVNMELDDFWEKMKNSNQGNERIR